MGCLPSIYLGRVCGNCGNEMIWRSDVTMMNLSASAAARQDVLKKNQHTLGYRYPNIISTNIWRELAFLCIFYLFFGPSNQGMLTLEITSLEDYISLVWHVGNLTVCILWLVIIDGSLKRPQEMRVLWECRRALFK